MNVMKILPVEWNYEIPFGLLYSPTPSENIALKNCPS